MLRLRSERAIDKFRVPDYTGERTKIFTTLGCLQSPEAVDLMIRMLNDATDYEEQQGILVSAGNDELAMRTILSSVEPLPLEKDKRGYYVPDLEALKMWGDKVRNGVSTFRFKGNPQLYNIHGPVDETAAASRERSAPPGHTSRPDLDTEKSVPWVPLGLSLLAVGWALGYFLRSRSSRRPDDRSGKSCA